MDLYAIQIRGMNFDPRLPPLPRTVVEVNRILQRREPEKYLAAFVQLIKPDPVATAYILRRVNSVIYGLRYPVSEVEQAVIYLGYREVSRILLTIGLLQLQRVFKTDTHREIYRSILRHGITSAWIAEQLGRQFQPFWREDGHLVALLHEMGRIILLYNEPDVYEALWMTIDERRGFPSSAAEEAVFGTNYLRVGEQAFRHWKFPESVALAVRYQHDPEAVQRHGDDVVSLAILAGGTCAATHFLYETDQYDTPVQQQALGRLARACQVSKEELLGLLDAWRPQVMTYVTELLQ